MYIRPVPLARQLLDYFNMLGLGLSIWTDVKGITKNSGSAVVAIPASINSTAKSTGKSVTSGGTLRYTPSQINISVTANNVTTTTG